MNLIEQIRLRIGHNTKLLLKIDNLVSSTLGRNWRDALDAQFDIELAEDSLVFIEASTIPSVSLNLPAEVSQVHFQSDLTNCPQVNLHHLKEQGGLFKAVLKSTSFKSKAWFK